MLVDHGAFSGSLSALSSSAIIISGDVTGSTLRFTGTKTQLRRLAALGSLTVLGSLSNSQVRAVGDVRAISVGGATSSTFFAGVSDAISGLPSATDFTSASSILSFTSRGKTAFADSFIAASTIGATTLIDATTDNAGTPFGLATESLAVFSATILGAKPFRWTTRQPVSVLATLPGDLRVNVLAAP